MSEKFDLIFSSEDHALFSCSQAESSEGPGSCCQQHFFLPFANGVSLYRCFRRIESLCGVLLSKDCKENLERDEDKFLDKPNPFGILDIIGLIERVKQMPILEYAEGTVRQRAIAWAC